MPGGVRTRVLPLARQRPNQLSYERLRTWRNYTTPDVCNWDWFGLKFENVYSDRFQKMNYRTYLRYKATLTKPPKYYYEGDSRAQILHTRLRLGCSSLNYDLFKNHVSDTDKCNCGLIESSDHLLHCARYDNIRSETLHKITLAYDTETLLKGYNLYSDRDNEEIFHYVHEFILKSARFT